MGKKIFKYLLWILFAIIGLVAIIFIALYIPPVQDFIKTKAVSYVSSNLGIRLSVERLRLKFPLKLAINNTTILTTDSDTLFHCNTLEANVAFIPLLRQDVVLRSFHANGIILDYVDDTTGMVLT